MEKTAILAGSGWSPLSGDRFSEGDPWSLALNRDEIDVVQLNSTAYEAATGRVHGRILMRSGLDALWMSFPLLSFWLPAANADSSVFGLPGRVSHEGLRVDLSIPVWIGEAKGAFLLRFHFDGSSPLPQTIEQGGIRPSGEIFGLSEVFRLISFERGGGPGVPFTVASTVGPGPEALGEWRTRLPEGSPVTAEPLAEASDAIERHMEFENFVRAHPSVRQIACSYEGSDMGTVWEVTYVAADNYRLSGRAEWDFSDRVVGTAPDVTFSGPTPPAADEDAAASPSYPDRVVTLRAAYDLASTFTSREPMVALWVETDPRDFMDTGLRLDDGTVPSKSAAKIGLRYATETGSDWEPIIVEISLVSPEVLELQFWL